ncbi:long-chain fatty acid--CoA ligase [Actinomadura sp. KC345]|uniref:class I adenylate-forming enzyme family protein n=1 Tax=Actinomadura sp. KC345 TaxID=2530371 RepID=UPI001050696D|nr:class I adenylate-forming enzyme family protein [Actinomadura sp. KC345]TDC41457.1 long-chain fatty acid--CoA ligase [Actinomadura sp. KC345]
MLQHTMVDQLRLNAGSFPDRPAIARAGASEDSLTYAQALDRVLRLATAVRRAADGSPVAILERNGPDAVLAFFACQLAGEPALPVNNLLAAPEIDYILDDSSAGVLLHGAEFDGVLDTLSPRRRPEPICSATLTGDADPWESFAPSDPSEPFIIGYTSGTTGFPKGAVYDGQGMYVQYLRWAHQFGLTSDTTVLTPGPMFHNSYGGLSILALLVGATNRVMTSFDAGTACDELAGRCTWAFLVPSMLTQIIDEWRGRGRPPLAAARFVLSSGSAADPALLDEAFDAFPNAVVGEAYGWSEGGWVTYEAKTRGAVVPQCVGRPMLGADVALFAPDGSRCPAGETGEIGVRNVTPFLGYVNPASRLESSADGRHLLSGDIGRFTEDGRLLVVDRKKDIIVTGGENVASGEVERVLADHPAVRETAVVGRPDPRWGEAVTAVVARTPDREVGEDELRAHCRARLAAYKVPKRFEFVPELPRNSMGKVQKFLLRASEAS